MLYPFFKIFPRIDSANSLERDNYEAECGISNTADSPIPTRSSRLTNQQRLSPRRTTKKRRIHSPGLNGRTSSSPGPPGPSSSRSANDEILGGHYFQEVLPVEILTKIFGYLTERELCVLSKTCSRFRKIEKESNLWEKFYKDVYGFSKPIVIDQEESSIRYVDTSLPNLTNILVSVTPTTFPSNLNHGKNHSLNIEMLVTYFQMKISLLPISNEKCVKTE